MGEFARVVNKTMLCDAKITISTEEADALGVMEKLIKKTQTNVVFIFENNQYKGKIARREGKKRGGAYIELSYPRELSRALSKKFIHTYLAVLSVIKKENKREQNAEAIKFKKINSDIIEVTALTCIASEYDSALEKIIEWKLFDLNERKSEKKRGSIVLKSYGWIDRKDLREHKNASNVVYYLCDEHNKQIYIGSGRLLGKRIGHQRLEIPNWNKFRYDVISPEYADFLQKIEMFAIRSYSNIMKNLGGYKFMLISDYQLNNKDCGRS